MSSTHTCLKYHFLFSTKGRRAWIADPWRRRLHGYLGGAVRTIGGIAEEVGGTQDHVHILAGLKATHRVSDFLREIKACSSSWVHTELGFRLFAWQDGYGPFTVGRRELQEIRDYIRGQEAHHRTTTFQEEYVKLLRELGIEFDERYLW